MNLAQGTPQVDIFLDNYRVLKALSFAQATPYQQTMQKEYGLAVRETCVPSTPHALADVPTRFLSQYYYTVALMGSAKNLHVVQLNDDPALPGRGKARIRLLNAVPDAPPLSLGVGGMTLFSCIPYGVGSDYCTITQCPGPISIYTSNGAAVTTIEPPAPNVRVYTVVLYGSYCDAGRLYYMIMGERD